MDAEGRAKCCLSQKSNIHGNLSQRSTLVMYHDFDKPNLINTCWNGNWLINDQESFNFMIL